MTNSALKGIKNIVRLGVLTLALTTGCIPAAFQVPATQSPAPSTRADLCNLLLSVGGTDADVQACLTATSISDADKARLCAASANLTADQKDTLRANLIKLGVDVNTCDILAGPSPSPTATPTPVTPGTEVPSVIPGTTAPTAEPTIVPTAAPTVSNQPIPSSSPTSGTGGGGSGSGGSGCGSSTCGGAPAPTSLDVGVFVSDSPIPSVTVSSTINNQ